MSDKFISNPHEVVRSGEVVKVKVMEVDVDRKRIGLSLRLTDEPGAPAPQKRGNRPAKQQRAPQKQSAKPATGSMADALRRAGLGG